MGRSPGSTITILWRRLAQRLGAGLILGVSTAWIVALGLQILARPVMKSMTEPSLKDWLLGRAAFATGAEEYWIGFRGWQGGAAPAPAWYLRRLHPTGARGTIVHAYGWPVRVLAGGRTFLVAEDFRDWGVISLAGPEAYAFPFEQAIVYRPLGLGSAIGGVSYAAVWWVVLGVPTSLLQIRAAKRRARRGLCPECGYDLAGQKDAGCPECGWARRAHPEPIRPA